MDMASKSPKQDEDQDDFNPDDVTLSHLSYQNNSHKPTGEANWRHFDNNYQM